MAYDEKWNNGWNLCKKHGRTKGLSKGSIYSERPGYVGIWLKILLDGKKITKEEYDNLM